MLKPSITLLCRALAICASAHGADYRPALEEGQVNISANSVPVVADVKLICEAFYGNASMVDSEWGTTVYLDEADFLKRVNERLLYLALPFGTHLEEN